MNISAGISEIAFSRSAGIKPEKVYMWPDYGRERIEKVRKVSGYGAQPIYFKPSPEEQEKILGQMQNRENSYGSDGRSRTQGPVMKPGSLFNAIA